MDRVIIIKGDISKINGFGLIVNSSRDPLSIHSEVDSGENDYSKILHKYYLKHLNRAVNSGKRSVAFSTISTKNYRVSSEMAAKIAVMTVISYVKKHESEIDSVAFIVDSEFDKERYKRYLSLGMNKSIGYLYLTIDVKSYDANSVIHFLNKQIKGDNDNSIIRNILAKILLNSLSQNKKLNIMAELSQRRIFNHLLINSVQKKLKKQKIDLEFREISINTYGKEKIRIVVATDYFNYTDVFNYLIKKIAEDKSNSVKNLIISCIPILNECIPDDMKTIIINKLVNGLSSDIAVNIEELLAKEKIKLKIGKIKLYI